MCAALPAAVARVGAGYNGGALALLGELLELADLAGFTEYAPPHARVTVEALLAAAVGDAVGTATAVEAFTRAAGCWAQFGNTLEHAYALLGLGRAMTTLGDPAAEAALSRALTLFTGMGAQPRIVECVGLLAGQAGEVVVGASAERSSAHSTGSSS